MFRNCMILVVFLVLLTFGASVFALEVQSDSRPTMGIWVVLDNWRPVFNFIEHECHPKFSQWVDTRNCDLMLVVEPEVTCDGNGGGGDYSIPVIINGNNQNFNIRRDNTTLYHYYLWAKIMARTNSSYVWDDAPLFTKGGKTIYRFPKIECTATSGDFYTGTWDIYARNYNRGSGQEGFRKMLETFKQHLNNLQP